MNTKNNPIFPQQGPGTKRSVIDLLLSQPELQGCTLSTCVTEKITQGGDILHAWHFLKSIRGVGDKVASFYIRDLIDIMGVNLESVKNRHLCQPIDIWVERTSRILASNPSLKKDQISKWLTTTFLQYNVNPERINMGIWFFGSSIAGSEYRLTEALKNLDIARILVDEFKVKIETLYQSF